MNFEYIDDDSIKLQIKHLAKKTLSFPYEYCEDESCKFLDFSPSAIIDSAIYAYFVVYFSCIRAIKDREKVLLFQNCYLSEFVAYGKSFFTVDSKINFEALFYKRMDFYFLHLMESNAYGDFADAAEKSFELIIKSDIVGLPDDASYHGECQKYHNSLNKLYVPFLKSIINIVI